MRAGLTGMVFVDPLGCILLDKFEARSIELLHKRNYGAEDVLVLFSLLHCLFDGNLFDCDLPAAAIAATISVVGVRLRGRCVHSRI